MDNRKRRRRFESLLGKIFILSLFLVLIVNLILPDKEQSEEENRMLETLPAPGLTSILNGALLCRGISWSSGRAT